MCINSLEARHSNKTFLSQRRHGSNLPLETTILHRSSRSAALKESGIGLQTVPFVSASQNTKQLRKYFLYLGKHSLDIGKNADVDNQHLKFNERSSTNLTGNLILDPKTTVYGLRVDYYQYIPQYLKNAFVQISIPVIHLENDIQLKITNGTPSTAENKTIEDYFRGEEMFTRMDDAIPRPLQEPLAFGKIAQKHDETSVADIRLGFGYDYAHDEENFFRTSAFLLVPTNKGTTGEFLYETRVGSGGHWGIGARLEGAHTIFKQEKTINDEKVPTPLYSTHGLELYFAGDLYYFFKNEETRLIGLKDSRGNTLHWGQYMLLGRIGTPLVLPAANVLGECVKVKPGFEYEGIIMLSYHNGPFTFELGHNVLLRNAEDVKRTMPWNDTAYGFVGSDYADLIVNFNNCIRERRIEARFSLEDSNLTNQINKMEVVGNGRPCQGTILETQLDPKRAATPATFINSFFVATSYGWDSPKSSYFIGGGAGYEFTANNVGLEQFMLWLKTGVLFY